MGSFQPPSLENFVNFFFAGIFLLVLSPVLLTVGLAVLIFDGRPILFTQSRLGLQGKPFRLYKFRTMKLQRDSEFSAKEHEPTALGKYLRISSLDELTQLWNVMKRDMNFVGPRPLLEAYRNLYSGQQFKRHEVRPGLTGLAQVSGRASLTWEEKFELDVEYVNTKSAVGDLVILMRTVPAVLSPANIAAGEKIGVKPFRGSKEKATSSGVGSESPDS